VLRLEPACGAAGRRVSDASAATFRSHFANSGVRLMFRPGDYPPGSHNLYIVAHSAVNGEQLQHHHQSGDTVEFAGGPGPHLARWHVRSLKPPVDQVQLAIEVSNRTCRFDRGPKLEACLGRRIREQWVPTPPWGRDHR